MDTAFWLRRSLGYRVEMPDGSVGVVRRVLASGDEPVTVSVAVVVPPGRSTFVAGIEDVRAVYPLRLRIVLNHDGGDAPSHIRHRPSPRCDSASP